MTGTTNGTPIASGVVADPSDELDDAPGGLPHPAAGPPAEVLPDTAASTVEPVEPVTPVRTRRPSPWDGPRPPKDWRWVVGGIGRTLIVTGLLLFAFVGYQLWGTGIEEAQSQRRLENGFEDLIADLATSTTVSATTAPSTTVPSSNPPTTTPDDPATSVPPPETDPPSPHDTAVPQLLPPIEPGDPIAVINMPTIGVEKFVVAGVHPDDLKKGPGHFSNTPLPGQLGNSGIAGHRTTYGAPFFRVDELEVGDPIITSTPFGTYTYRVTGQEIVGAGDGQVLATTNPDIAMLTLVSCHPRYTARDRIIVYAELDIAASDPVGQPLIQYRPLGEVIPGEVDELPGEDTVPGVDPDAGPSDGAGNPSGTDELDDPSETVVVDAGGSGPADLQDELEDAFSRGWFSDRDAWPQVVLWGLVLIAIAVGSHLFSRFVVRRRWIGGLVGLVPFVVALYFWFQNVNRLLPPGL